MLTCYDSFSYPSLTEGRDYECKKINYGDESVLIVDDTDNEWRYPLRLFFSNEIEYDKFIDAGTL